MNPDAIQGDVAHAIQLALAPVFLLGGIAGMLNVMTTRLNRIVDRGRYLVETPSGASLSADKIAAELRTLERRRHCASVAITNSTLSALLVCVVVVMLFMDVLLGLPLKWMACVIFTGSVFFLLVSLAYFLREIHLANQTASLKHKLGSFDDA